MASEIHLTCPLCSSPQHGTRTRFKSWRSCSVWSPDPWPAASPLGPHTRQHLLGLGPRREGQPEPGSRAPVRHSHRHQPLNLHPFSELNGKTVSCLVEQEKLESLDVNLSLCCECTWPPGGADRYSPTSVSAPEYPTVGDAVWGRGHWTTERQWQPWEQIKGAFYLLAFSRVGSHLDLRGGA